jgi:signal peptide peptidase SppA
MHPQIASRLFSAPLLIHPDKAQIIAGALGERLGVGAGAIEASRFFGSRRRGDGRRTLTRAERGVAIIAVEGTLVNRGAWIDANSGLTSYEGIGAQIREAASDPEVSAILLDINSPGGEAGGMFNLAAAIREARKSKRVVAVVDDVAASAAYGIASATNEIVVSPTSMVGSIGVVWLHLDRSGELEKDGIKPTLIFAGARKVDGNEYGPLTTEAAEDTKKIIGAFYDRFIETVAAGRGDKLSMKLARETEARVFIGADAIRAGLADRIASLDEVLGQLTSNHAAATSRPRSGARSMYESEKLRAEEQDEKVKAGWAKAVANANQSIGVEPEAVAAGDDKEAAICEGWRKAIEAANRRFENAEV